MMTKQFLRRTGLASASLLLVIPIPALAQQTDYGRAVAARLAGDPELAIAILEPWLAAHPDDVDARVQYGYALLAVGRLEAAQAAFERVLQQAPDYADAQDGLAAIALRRASQVPETRRASLVLDASISTLEGPQSNWSEAGFAAALPIGDRDGAEIHGRWYRRFDLEDIQFGADYTRHAGKDVWLRLGASGTPSADFRPRIAASGGIDYRIGEATVVSFDAEWQDFPAEKVWSFSPGITRYFDHGRFAASVKGRALAPGSGGLLVGGLLRGDFIPQDRTRFFLGGASGPETDLGVVSDTSSVFAGTELPLHGSVSLQGSMAHEWREVGANRFEARIGIKLGL